MGPKVRRLTLVHKEGKAAIARHVIDYWICGLHDYCALFNYLVEIVVLLSTRYSYLGIPYPFLRGLLRELSLYFSTFRLEAKLPPSATTYFMFRFGLCCRVLQWRVENTTSRACFSEEAFFPLED